MYAPPNPVEALRNTLTTRVGRIATTPVSTTPTAPHMTADDAWDGSRCVFAYSYETATNWPPVPTFLGGTP